MTASVEQAVAAAVAVARQHGLTVDDPALLSWGVNAVVHLRPAPMRACAGATSRTPPAAHGPGTWDLASLRHSARLDGRAALDAMPDPMSDAELAPFRWFRQLYSAAWWFVHAAREPTDLPEARQRLDAAVTEVGAGLR